MFAIQYSLERFLLAFGSSYPVIVWRPLQSQIVAPAGLIIALPPLPLLQQKTRQALV
jgi:hypothetical protein